MEEKAKIENYNEKSPLDIIMNFRDENQTTHSLIGSTMKDNKNSYAVSPTKVPFKNNQSITYTICPSFSDKLKVAFNKEAKKEETKEQSSSSCTDMTECKLEHIEEIVNLKKEFEDSESAFNKEILRYNKESLVIDVKYNPKDFSTSSTDAIAGLDIPIKHELKGPADNFANGIEQIDIKDSDYCEKITFEKVMQNDFTTVSNEKGDEALSMQSSDNGNVQLGNNDQIQLETSIVFTTASECPQNELNKTHSDTENSTLEKHVASIDVSLLGKKYLELNKNDYLTLCEAYLNSLSTIVEPRQKLYKICSRVQEKDTGRALLVSKYCTVIPKVINPLQGMNLNRPRSTISVENYKNNESKGNTYSKKYCVPEKNSVENSIGNRNDKNLDISTKSESIKYKSSDKTSFGRINTDAMSTLKMHLSNNMIPVQLINTRDTTVGNTHNLANAKKGTEISENRSSFRIEERCNTEENIKNSITFKENNKNKVKAHLCHCGKSFDDREQHLEHIRKDHWKPKEFTCEDCNQSYSKWRDYSRHKCDDSKQKCAFVCSSCGKSFESDKCLQNHTHKKSKCKDCDKVFCYTKDLTSHMKEHLKLSCKFCLKKFYTSWNLMMHVRNVHTSLKCEHCKKKFMNTIYLKKHIQRKHDNVNDHQFECKGCNSKFVNKQIYKLHEEICSHNHKSQKSVTMNLIKDDKQQTFCDTIPIGSFVKDDEISEKDQVKNSSKLFPTSEESAPASALISNISGENDEVVGEYTKTIKAEKDVRTTLLQNDDISETFEFYSSTINAKNQSTSILTDSRSMLPENIKTKSGIPDQNIKNTRILSNAIRHEISDINKDVEKSKFVTDQENVRKGGTSKGEINYHECNEEVVIISDTENEDLKQPESSQLAGRYDNEDRLIISNSLFKKRDQLHRLNWKRKTRTENEEDKKDPTRDIQKNSSELKKDRRNIVDLKKKLDGIKSKLQMITRKINLTQNATMSVNKSVISTVSHFDEGRVKDQRIASQKKVELSGKDKKNATSDEKSLQNSEVIVIESSSDSDEEVDNLSGKRSVKLTVVKEDNENESDKTDSESEIEEDDEDYEEEIIRNRTNTKENTVYKDNLRITTNINTELIKGNVVIEKEENIDKSRKRPYDDINHYGRNKLEMNNDIIPSIKLKRVSVVLIDIFKTNKHHIASSDSSKQKVEQKTCRQKEVIVKGVCKIDDSLGAAPLSSSILSSDTFDCNKFRNVDLRSEDVSDDELSSESASDDDNEGYEEVSIEDL